jgi:hypothetical protein
VKIPEHNTPRGTWCRFSGVDSKSGVCLACAPTLDELRRDSPKDAAVIEACAAGGMFFYDGAGVILPSGRRCTGAEMRALVAEAGYNPLTRAHAIEHGPFPPDEPARNGA